MEIQRKKEGDILAVTLSGRLDTNTAPELQDSLTSELEGIKSLTIDMSELDYVSSAGLRVLLFLYKQCTAQGASMALLHCNDVVKDVLKMTGFDQFLKIQEVS